MHLFSVYKYPDANHSKEVSPTLGLCAGTTCYRVPEI